MEQSNNIYRATFPSPCRKIITPLRVLNADKKKEVVVQALWDTGSSSSFISAKAAAFLRTVPTGDIVRWQAANGKFSTRTVVTVALPGDTAYATIAVAGIMKHMPYGVDFVIGLDIIDLGDFSLTHEGEDTVLTFRFSDRFFQLRKNANGEVF